MLKERLIRMSLLRFFMGGDLHVVEHVFLCFHGWASRINQGAPDDTFGDAEVESIGLAAGQGFIDLHMETGNGK
jgi:hypothetical protein